MPLHPLLYVSFGAICGASTTLLVTQSQTKRRAAIERATLSQQKIEELYSAVVTMRRAFADFGIHATNRVTHGYITSEAPRLDITPVRKLIEMYALELIPLTKQLSLQCDIHHEALLATYDPDKSKQIKALNELATSTQEIDAVCAQMLREIPKLKQKKH